MKVFSLLLFTLFFSSTSFASKIVTFKVEDKHGMSVPNVPIYIQQFEEARRLTSRGGLPYFEKYSKPVIQKMWKTNNQGIVKVTIDEAIGWNNPSIGIDIGIIAYSGGGASWSSFEVGHSDNEGSFVMPDLHAVRVTPRSIPNTVLVKTYYADAQEVQANIQEALRKASHYEVIPGYKE